MADTGVVDLGAGATESRGDRDWIRISGLAAAFGMAAWVVGVLLIPLDAKLDKGDQYLAMVVRSHAVRLYVAGLLAVLGAVLLAGFFTVLAGVIREKYAARLLRISLVGCVITQTMVAVGVAFALAAVHASRAGSAAGIVAFGWRGLWLTFSASALPTVLFTVPAVVGLRRAGLSPAWVSALGWLSAAAHILAVCTLGQAGAFAPDGIIAALVPLTTVLWVVSVALTLPARAAARPDAG
jgi:hypothetical protein